MIHFGVKYVKVFHSFLFSLVVSLFPPFLLSVVVSRRDRASPIMQIQSGPAMFASLTSGESTIWIPLCSIDTQGTAEHSQTSKLPHHMHTVSSGSEHTQ